MLDKRLTQAIYVHKVEKLHQALFHNKSYTHAHRLMLFHHLSVHNHLTIMFVR